MIPLEYPSVASLMYILCTIFYSLLYYNMDMQKYVFGKAPHGTRGRRRFESKTSRDLTASETDQYSIHIPPVIWPSAELEGKANQDLI